MVMKKAAKVKKSAKKKSEPFGGKRAAPFAKGGGRVGTHPNTAKGTKRRGR